MNTTGNFWALVRHEMKMKGSWRKQNRSNIARSWWIVYIALIVLAGFGTATYYALQHTLRLEYLWFATFGLPYMIFFAGFSNFKREWENDTYGWWLTLPYPRLKLVAAKWIAAVLQIVILIIAVLLIGLLYASIIAATLDTYSFNDVYRFMAAGFRWILPFLGLAPFILSLGIFTSIVQISSIRPVSPILWVVFMGSGSMAYSNSGTLFAEYYDFSPGGDYFMLPVWEIIAGIAASWLIAVAVIKLSSYLLEKKCSL